MSRIPKHLYVLQDQEAKRSQDFEPRCCFTKLHEASLEGRPGEEVSRLSLYVKVAHRETKKEDEVFLGHVTHYEDGLWSYLHADEDVRRGLFDTVYEAVRRLIHGATSGNDAPVAYQRVREVKKNGLASTRQTHPAFGLLRFSRISCGGGGENFEGARLFGSQVRHPTVIEMTVSQATVDRDLGKDWHGTGDTKIEVRMSSAQFAAAIGSMNYGQGVPVTITRVLNRAMPDLPELPSIPELAMEDLGEGMADVMRRIEGVEKEIKEASKQLGKGRTKQLLDQIKISKNSLGKGFPFVRKQFCKSLEKTVAEAKTEIDATASLTAQRIGEKVLDGTLPVQIGEEISRMPSLPEVTTLDQDPESGEEE